ncbi:MAG TPA: condensation domain-containing protein, partial [Candidatus Polarisedimenticolia bacterium]|nr:condensation domain-containing protein [Candidatus Polarisedimenticolia bacterium]
MHQLEPSSSAYNVHLPVRIHAPVDVDAMRRTFQKLVDRHAPLRSTFGERDGLPFQREAHRLPVRFEALSASGCDLRTLNRRVLERAHEPFDLERGPVFRVALFTLNPEEHILLVSAHHIATDMWSTVVLMEEMHVLYPAERAGKAAVLPPLAAEYTDYVHWQREMISSPEGEAHWAYWKKALSGGFPALDLAVDRPRPLVQTYRGDGRKVRIDEALTGRLKALAASEKVTFFTLLLGAFQTLLHRYTGQTNVLVGSPAAARSRPEFEAIVGYFVNPLVFRADFSDDPPFRDFLKRSRVAVVGALDHQDFPFPLLVERLQPERDPARSPIFQAMFSFERPHRARARNSPAFLFGEEGTRRPLAGLDLEPFLLETKGAQFDLTLAVHESRDALNAFVEYNADLFNASSIDRMVTHFRTLLEGIVEDPSSRVSALPLLDPAGRRRVLEVLSGALSSPSSEERVHERIEKMAHSIPEATALVVGDECLSYRQLEARATRLAARLRGRGVSPGAIVGILADRSVEAIVGILGVLKAGGAYLPLDPALPRERLALLVEDAKPALMLAPRRLGRDLHALVPEILDLETGGETESVAPGLVPSRPGPEDPAYVIYTSGSTGSPKGVVIPHRGL